MNGSDIRKRREELGLSRPQLVDRLLGASIGRMTVGILAGIEVRSDEIRTSEVPIWYRALGLESDGTEPVVRVDEPPPVKGKAKLNGKRPPWLKDDETIVHEWAGLSPGSIFTVEGLPRQRFEFVYYLESPREVYVQGIGGKSGHRLCRQFRPEKVRVRGRRIVHVGEDTRG